MSEEQKEETEKVVTEETKDEGEVNVKDSSEDSGKISEEETKDEKENIVEDKIEKVEGVKIDTSSESSEVYIPQTVEGKVEYSEKLKIEGNEFYKKKEYRKALKKYKTIFLYITGLGDNIQNVMTSNMGPPIPGRKQVEQTDIEKRVNIVKKNAYLNVAACYAALGKGRLTRNYAGRVLKEDKENIKAIFRRGQGWMIDGFVENAENDFKKVQAKFPGDRGVKRAMIRLKKRKKQVLKKEKTMYKNMKFE